jgi:hypothetical protein
VAPMPTSQNYETTFFGAVHCLQSYLLIVIFYSFT